MLLKNLSLNPQSTGRFKIEPNHWGCAPAEIATVWGSGDERFLAAPSRNPNPDKADIVIFSGCPLGTTGGGQHPPQIARALAKQGHRILFVQIVPQACEIENMIVVGNPYLMSSKPATKEQKAEVAHLLESFSAGQHDNKICLFTFPTGYTASLVNVANALGYRTAYWCLDDWEAIHKGIPHRNYNPAVEVEMAKSVHNCFATADCLSQHIYETSGKACTTIPNGFSDSNFPPVRQKPFKPGDLRLGHKTVVYWGELQGAWIDWEAIKKLALDHPTWQINLIGPNEQIVNPPRMDNIHYLGVKRVEDLHFYGDWADIGIIPFKPGAVSAAVNPIKAYEYLACGLMVVGMDIPELRKFPCAIPYSTTPTISKACDLAIQSQFDKNKVTKFLGNATWYSRATAFMRKMECRSPLQALLPN